MTPHSKPMVSMLTISLFWGVVSTGCASTTPPPPRSTPPETFPETEAFLADERSALGLLAAADPRIAARTGVQPTADQSGKAVLGAILAEDPSAALEAGRTDIFSFDVRARALATARQHVAKYNHPIPDPKPTDGRKPELERQLLLRLLDEEDARLVEERALPRSAATLVRDAAQTWTAPTSAADLEQRDAWFAGRIDRIKASLEPKKLPSDDIAELEDALDPLERVAFGDGTPYVKSHAAFTDLRIALGSLTPGPRPDAESSRAALAAGLRAHLGVTLSLETLARLFETAAAGIERNLATLVGATVDDARVEAEARALLGEAPCTFRATSTLRRSPSPERRFACTLAARAEKGGTADAIAGALVSAHTAMTVASWALWIASGASAVTPAGQHQKPLRPLPTDVMARLERFAATSPVRAIARGLAGEWIYRDGITESQVRGLAWMLFGDVPFDLLEREVQPHAVVPQKPPVLKVENGPAK